MSRKVKQLMGYGYPEKLCKFYLDKFHNDANKCVMEFTQLFDGKQLKLLKKEDVIVKNVKNNDKDTNNDVKDDDIVIVNKDDSNIDYNERNVNSLVGVIFGIGDVSWYWTIGKIIGINEDKGYNIQSIVDPLTDDWFPKGSPLITNVNLIIKQDKLINKKKPIIKIWNNKEHNLEIGTMLDVRDKYGKWINGSIVEEKDNFDNVQINYEGWSSNWNEWFNAEQQKIKFSNVHDYTTTIDDCKYFIGQTVFVYVQKLKPCAWVPGKIDKIDNGQVRVKYYRGKDKYQYWYHCKTNEIEDSGEPRPTEEYFIGQYVEVKDTVNKWLAAEIQAVKYSEIKVHYHDWGAKWDEWLQIPKDSSKIRPLGQDLKESDIEKQKKQNEEDFIKKLTKETNFDYVTIPKDGNCMFRTFAHQFYNNQEKHMELRETTCKYILDNKDYFKDWVASNDKEFEAYLTKMKKKNVWGGHVEMVALGEIFNCTVKVFDEKSIQGRTIVGSDKYEIPKIRLAYRGSNHYNSIVNPKEAIPYEKAKSDDKINLREIRRKTTEEEEKKVEEIKKEIAKKEKLKEKNGSKSEAGKEKNGKDGNKNGKAETKNGKAGNKNGKAGKKNGKADKKNGKADKKDNGKEKNGESDKKNDESDKEKNDKKVMPPTLDDVELLYIQKGKNVTKILQELGKRTLSKSKGIKLGSREMDKAWKDADQDSIIKMVAGHLTDAKSILNTYVEMVYPQLK